MTDTVSGNVPDRREDVLAALLDGHACAVAESCTGGLISETLGRIEGSSEWFRGGLVAYQHQTKYDLLGVTPGPVVTATAAEEMAAGAAKLFGATATVSVTGAAGPEPLDGAKPGTVFIATCVGGAVSSQEYHFEGDPTDVCEQAKDAALTQLIDALE